MSTTFGLDFGTTNSALSVSSDDQVEVVDIDEHNTTGKTLRSVLYFDEENNIFVGQEAIQNYIDNGAIGRFMQSIKSFLPSKQFDQTYINRKRYELDDLIAIILKRIKDKGEEYVGHEVDDVVMGRPVVFSEDVEKDRLAENRLRKAAEKAGFKNIKFQLEPIAAALTFEETLNEGEEKIVLIGDFGGGTSDFTVFKSKGGSVRKVSGRQGDVLAVGGVYVGGDTFNSQLMWGKVAKYFGKDVTFKSMTNQSLEVPTSITFKLRNWHLIPQLRERSMREYIKQIKHTADDRQAIENLENLIEDNFGFMLFQAIEKAKIDLSSYEKSHIVFRERDLSIKEAVKRTEFDDMIAEGVGKIRKCVDSVLSDAGVIAEEVDTVFMTGGSSYIPCIRRIFIEKFGEGKMRQGDAFTSVAYGLGISSAQFFN
jgi:hypothetical chaperone protein